jgi:hypothetical protein
MQTRSVVVKPEFLQKRRQLMFYAVYRPLFTAQNPAPANILTPDYGQNPRPAWLLEFQNRN